MEERLRELLGGRHVATLATENADGSLYLSAVWFLELDGAVYIATGRSTRQARNADARARAGLLIDARGPGALRGAAATGTVNVLGGDDALALNERVWAKYLTPLGLAEPQVGGAIRVHDDVAIRFVPERWRTWSTAEDFGGAFERDGISFPLDH